MTEGIIARRAGQDSVAPGDNVWVDVDKLMTHDVCGPGTFGIFEKEFGEDAQVRPQSFLLRELIGDLALRRSASKLQFCHTHICFCDTNINRVFTHMAFQLFSGDMVAACSAACG